MRRAQFESITRDLEKKMVLLVGPRQVGKTWLAREIGKIFSRTVYLNYDSLADREKIQAMQWPHDTELLIFDELHKMRGWKNFLKGVFDTRAPTMRILVSGSARLNAHRKMGDSMVGRYFVHHILPLSLKELSGTEWNGDIDRLLLRGGFPEPFLALDPLDFDRWRHRYAENMIRGDVLDFATVEDVRVMQEVFDALRRSVGSPVSFSSIAGMTGSSPITIKRYIGILEALYIIFLVRPYTKKISRSILKEPKAYFFDSGLALDDGARFENMVAVSLLKQNTSRADLLGKNWRVGYLRTKEGKEIDFALSDENNELKEVIEVKLSDDTPSKTLLYFSEKYKVQGTQIVGHLRNDFMAKPSVRIVDATRHLSNLFA